MSQSIVKNISLFIYRVGDFGFKPSKMVGPTRQSYWHYSVFILNFPPSQPVVWTVWLAYYDAFSLQFFSLVPVMRRALWFFGWGIVQYGGCWIGKIKGDSFRKIASGSLIGKRSYFDLYRLWFEMVFHRNGIRRFHLHELRLLGIMFWRGPWAWLI